MNVKYNNIIRSIVSDYYDIQTYRIMVEGQIRAYEQEATEFMDDINFKKAQLARLKDIEKDTAKYLGSWVKSEPIYTEWLKGVKGIGPIISAGLIANVGDAKDFGTISKLWRFAGQGVMDGRAERPIKGQKLIYNKKLKVLCWKIGESFIKSKGGYRELYEQFRQEYDEKWITSDDCGSKGCANKGKKITKGENKGKRECMKGHKYAAAKRKTVKVFLAHYHMMGRKLNALPIEHPFIMGQDHHNHEIEIVME